VSATHTYRYEREVHRNTKGRETDIYLHTQREERARDTETNTHRKGRERDDRDGSMQSVNSEAKVSLSVVETSL